MSSFRTGRTRPITVEFQPSAQYSAFYDGSMTPAGGLLAYPVISGNTSWGSIGAYVSFIVTVNPGGFPYGSRYLFRLWFQASLPAFSLSDLQPRTIDDLTVYVSGYGTPTRKETSGSISGNGVTGDWGTLSISSVEEWVEWGTISVDSTGRLTVPARLFEKAAIKATVVAEFGEARVEHTIDNAAERDALGEIDYGMGASVREAVNGGTATAIMAPFWNGDSPVADTQNRTDSGTGWSVTNNLNSQIQTAVTHTPGTGAPLYGWGIVSGTLYQPRSVSYEGVVRSFASAYPDTIAAVVYGDPDYPSGKVVPVDSIWNHSFDQRRWDVSFYAGDAEPVTFRQRFNTNEWVATSCKLDPESLTDADENDDADEAYIRGYRWTVGNFAQSSTLQIAGAFTRTNNTAYSLPDGSTAAGAKGTHPDFWGANKASLQGYRYLSIPLIHNNANPQTLTSVQIGSKTWSVDKDGKSLTIPNGSAYKEILLDLCNPDGTEETDIQDTRYPFNRVDTWAWGVTSANGIILNGIAGGVKFTAEKAVLKRLGKTLLTVLPTYGNMVNKDTLSPSPWKYRCDFLVCTTDGKKSQEQSDVKKPEPADWTFRDIETIKDEIMDGTYPSDGFSMTANAPSGDTDDLTYYLSETAPAWCLWGSGAWYDAARDPGEEWQYAIDLDATEGISIPGQVLITEITDWMPGAGDAFELGSYGGALKLRAASFLRGQAAGLVFRAGGTSSRRKAWSGATVSVKESTGGANAGSGLSGGQGFYRSGLPYAKTAISGGHKVELQSGAIHPFENITFAPRKRRRVSFRGTPVCCDNLFCVPTYYFPFTPQFSDPNTLPTEDWRNFARSPQENETNDAQAETEGTSE